MSVILVVVAVTTTIQTDTEAEIDRRIVDLENHEPTRRGRRQGDTNIDRRDRAPDQKNLVVQANIVIETGEVVAAVPKRRKETKKIRNTKSLTKMTTQHRKPRKKSL